jgi:hypothetical protein
MLVWQDYLRPWNFLAATYAREKNPRAAARCRERALHWSAPGSGSIGGVSNL